MIHPPRVYALIPPHSRDYLPYRKDYPLRGYPLSPCVAGYPYAYDYLPPVSPTEITAITHRTSYR